jgi:HrpA-like RNA helicase
MRQVFEGERHDGAIVVIDEAHEWNLNLELLVAWFRLKLSRGFDIRLVIMSATIEAELLATYFDDAEVISSKGRTFPITEIKPKGGLIGSIKTLLRQKFNVLVFLPGKAEIRRLITKLRATDVEAEILPLHADLSPGEQDACFKSYDHPKCVVATNVAQTSITVPDIDAVVDGGMERRPEMVDGVEGLYLRPISLADREQRKGRAGRVKVGVYIDCCPFPVGERKLFPRPAILTRGLESLVLQLAYVGLDPEDVRFFHKPPQRHIDDARQVLKKLRCLDDGHTITKIGKLVASFPIGVRYARMVIESYHQGPHSGYIDGKALTLAIILEEGGVRNRKSDAWKQYAPPLPLGGLSDAYVELVAFEAAESIPMERLEEVGIDDVAFYRIKETRQRVLGSIRSRGLRVGRVFNTSLQRVIAAGLADQLYKQSLGGKDYARVGSRSMLRHLPPDSCVQEAEYVVGIPWNFQVKTEFGPQTKRWLQGATEVSPKLIERVSG